MLSVYHSISGPVGTGMDDRLRPSAYLINQPPTPTSYHQQDGKWVPAYWWWCSAARE